MRKVVTYTTRPMRVGEVNHIDYHFVSKEEFIEKANNNFFIETACYNDNYYGTAYEDISRNKVFDKKRSEINKKFFREHNPIAIKLDHYIYKLK